MITGPPTHRQTDRVAGPFANIGAVPVRLRWLVVIVWLAAAVVIPKALPSLSSASRSENTAFLPSDTPVVKADALATPFERQNSASTLLVAGRAPAPLTAGDNAAIARAEAQVARVPGRGLRRSSSMSWAWFRFRDLSAASAMAVRSLGPPRR